MHSHDYRVPEAFADQRVVVVGMGNSAMDISVELSYTAKQVYLSHRRGVHIVPKYIWGRPLDKWPAQALPLKLANFILQIMIRIQQGKVENFGLKKPAHSLMQSHPTISGTILDRLAHGDVQPVDNIQRLVGDKVIFEDGREEEIDTIIYCTGYKVTFPFFDEEFLSAPDNDLPLFERMMKPEIPNLFFIGLFQPLGAIFPLSERQSYIAADYLAGEYQPPSKEEMHRRTKQERETMFIRYVASKRHTMQVDYDIFMAHLEKEWNAGRRRAATAGNPMPVQPQAKSGEAVLR